jgi:hypothetical protein
MERRGSVQDDFQSRCPDHLVKGVWLRNVWNYGNGEVARGGLSRVCLADLGGLVLGADSRHHFVALGEELFEDVG